MSFVVIEGLDGSGKSTQIKMLKDYFEKQKIRYQYLHFPRTDSPVYGDLIARFLRGEMGNINDVDPYLVALIYAGDRETAKEMVREWLRGGSLVLVDRYVISNIAFQCAKLGNSVEADKLKHWILNLEYEFNKLPVPDLNIFLDVPFSFTSQQLQGNRTGDDRDYLRGAADIHESNLEFQKQVREIYLSLEDRIPGYHVLDCSGPGGGMLPPGEIFQKIINLVMG
ncbi:MAG TPA: dTMP kinase [Bacteroidales bacterium]|nr:dTMP kinase [Bacteroidales bacterium]